MIDDTFALEAPIRKSAEISDCGLYRYELARSWGDRGPDGRVVFVMLNPSTADAANDDPTIRRCIGFAKSWGYDSIAIVNLFAFRSAYPADLWKAGRPVGPENDAYIRKNIIDSRLVVCAWGSHAKARPRAGVVLRILAGCGLEPHAIRQTKDGSPGHPLYLPSHLRPTPMEIQP